jgi:chromosome segregation ATPase
MIELSWAYVVETEKIIEGIMKEKKISEKAKEKHQQKIDNNDAEFERTNSEFNKKKSEINELTNAIKGSGSTYEEVTAKWKKASMNVKSVQTELKKLNSQLDKKTRDSKELADKLNEEKKKNETDYQDEKNQKEAAINEIKEKLKEISNMEKTKSQDNQMLSGDMEKNRRAVSDKNYDLMENEKTVKKYEAEIENLKNVAKNQLCKFGDFMPELVNDVKRHFEMKKFKQMPRGPLGMYIQPKESSWTLAIEQCLGFLLTAFVCDNYDDEKVMHQLIAKHVSQVRQRPRVIVSDFSTPLYDSRRFRPATTQYSTVYEMLNIKDNVVANTLMDQRKVESVLLLPDRQAGREVIEQNSTQNCSEAFLKNGDRYMGLPSFRMYSCAFSTPKYFIENTEGAITAKKRDITRFNEQVLAIRQEIKVLTDQLKNSQTLKQKNDTQLEALKREQLKLNNKLREAESINIHEPVDLAVFEGEIESIMEEIERIKAQIQEIESNNAEVREEFERRNQEKLKYDQEKRCLDEKIEQVTQTFNSLDEERNKYKDASKYYKGLLNEVIAKDQLIDKKLADQQTEFEVSYKF